MYNNIHYQYPCSHLSHSSTKYMSYHPQHDIRKNFLPTQRTQCIHSSHCLINYDLVAIQDTSSNAQPYTPFLSQASFSEKLCRFTHQNTMHFIILAHMAHFSRKPNAQVFHPIIKLLDHNINPAFLHLHALKNKS